MHCLYHPKANRTIKEYFFENDDLKHLKAIRLRVGEKVMITNGQGLSIIANIGVVHNNGLVIENPLFFEDYGELDIKVSVGLAILDNRERMEFALEKCIELGAKEFYPLITKNSQKKIINIERLKAKSISALKQCQRSQLIEIYPAIDIFELERKFVEFDSIILADFNGETYNTKFRKSSNLILIGPEGGFTDEEINFIKKNPKTISVNLGKRRLRAETAAIAMMALLSNGA
ncbi:MAG: 16S rRNA (uracil(1498)-N(3))-methyltransferase [Candidatus Kapabacteria bacterium]|nr:16S rRNA (uracil(1498)-N(3))-methyltransferase [Candidatus Kapabacteria bacterium]